MSETPTQRIKRLEEQIHRAKQSIKRQEREIGYTNGQIKKWFQEIDTIRKKD